MKLVFSEEYYNMIPRPTKEETRALENSIMLNGLQEPITHNECGVILDGYTRYEICTARKIPMITEEKKFDSPEEEKRYVLETNVTRRQLTPFQKVEIFIDIFKVYQQQAYNNKCNSNYEKRNFPVGKSAVERYSEFIGIGEKRTHYALKILQSNNSNLKKKCRNGTITITQAYELLTTVKRERKQNYKTYPNIKNLLQHYSGTEIESTLREILRRYREEINQ